MKQGHVTFKPEGRAGNFLFMAANAMAYALDHHMPFHMPTTSRDPFWCPTYLPHLAASNFDQSLTTIVVSEDGYEFQRIPWDERWREGHNIVLNGFWQSPKYFAHHRERVLEAFDFQWMPTHYVGVHIRRGDYLVHTTKHPAVPAEWYLAQMGKFPGAQFLLFSDDHQYLKDTFGHRKDCCAPSNVVMDSRDPRPEVQDLIRMSHCAHLIGSASTFAVWAGLLNRNPHKRIIIPKEWICPGWESTTADTWLDVVPTGPGWERA